MMNRKCMDILCTMSKNCCCYSGSRNISSIDDISNILMTNKAQQGRLKEGNSRFVAFSLVVDDLVGREETVYNLVT